METLRNAPQTVLCGGYISFLLSISLGFHYTSSIYCCCCCFFNQRDTISKYFEDVPLVEFMYLVFPRIPDKSYRRRFMSFLLCLRDVFRALINSLVCRFCFSFVWKVHCFAVQRVHCFAVQRVRCFAVQRVHRFAVQQGQSATSAEFFWPIVWRWFLTFVFSRVLGDGCDLRKLNLSLVHSYPNLLQLWVLHASHTWLTVPFLSGCSIAELVLAELASQLVGWSSSHAV